MGANGILLHQNGEKKTLHVHRTASVPPQWPKMNSRVAKLSTMSLLCHPGSGNSGTSSITTPNRAALSTLNTVSLYLFWKGPFRLREAESLSIPMNFLPSFWAGVPWILHPIQHGVRTTPSALRTVGSGTAWSHHFPLNVQILSCLCRCSCAALALKERREAERKQSALRFPLPKPLLQAVQVTVLKRRGEQRHGTHKPQTRQTQGVQLHYWLLLGIILCCIHLTTAKLE